MRLHTVDNNSLHSFIANPLIILLRFFKSGGPFDSSLPLSIQTLGFWSQLSQSYRNLSIHTPFTSLIQPSRFILANKLAVQVYHKALLVFLMGLFGCSFIFPFRQSCHVRLRNAEWSKQFHNVDVYIRCLNFKIT